MKEIIYENQIDELMTIMRVGPGTIVNELQRFGYDSMNYETLMNWRKNKTQPDIVQAKIVASLFGITLEKLVKIVQKKAGGRGAVPRVDDDAFKLE